jgi:hypothetical protein
MRLSKLKLDWIVSSPITIFLIFTLFSLNSSASENEKNIQEINQAIQNKLDFYNKQFPEIQFVHLKNGEWEKSLQALELFIGYQATNLDYEHPPELREDLLYVTVAKIQMMLVNRITSSYLFKVGDIPAASRQHVCVITLDPATTVLNNLVSTQYFIDLPQEILKSLPLESYIDNQRHLDFIIDHEAYHCLDTFNYGGIPMSDKAYSTRYDSFKRESQADMFALAMHLQRNKTFSPCAEQMMMLRGMTLLNGEMQHYSLAAMQLIIDSEKKQIIDSQPEELLRLVKRLYKTIAPGYEEYMKYRVAAVSAITQLGKQVNEMEKPFAPADIQPDEKLVKELIKQTQDYYQRFTGKNYKLPAH